ncbi:hypothetical protein MCEMSEM18_03219 [Comamonadaceae bacterium]
MKDTERITSWITELETDPTNGEMLLTFKDDFLQQEDWRVGDRIRFEEAKRGGMRLLNVSKLERDKSD